jgi:glycine/D-amino acid oxidase-like deaminating enzyme
MSNTIHHSKNNILKQFDYIIVGQGLAGTILAYTLLNAGQKVIIIDNDTEMTASKIAAGVINPVTGRRIVKSWRVEALLPVAKSIYQAIEQRFDFSIFRPTTICKAIRTVEEENEWLLRSGYPAYQAYCAPTADVSSFKDKIYNFHAYGAILQAAQVNVPNLILFFKKHFSEKEILLKEAFDYDDLEILEKEVHYRGYLKASKIIFCEGAGGVKNPFFEHLPFNLDKGELLKIKIPNAHFDMIFKNHLSIVPLDLTQNLYWVGATNEWKFAHPYPTEAQKQLIINELKSILKVPFEVIAHQAAIRPTVKDRRPFIGFHPNFPVLAIFNGFGTKGASLIPFWAEHFKAVLVHQQPLDSEVNTHRFY